MSERLSGGLAASWGQPTIERLQEKNPIILAFPASENRCVKIVLFLTAVVLMSLQILQGNNYQSLYAGWALYK